MTEVGVTRDGEDTVAVVVRLPISALEAAGLTALPVAPAGDTSPGATAAAPAPEPEPAAVDPQPGEEGHPLGPSGTRDLSPPSSGVNVDGDTVETEKPKSPARKRSGSSSSRKRSTGSGSTSK